MAKRMTTSLSSDDASLLVKLVSRAIEGVGPLKPARELADDYRTTKRHASDCERVDALAIEAIKKVPSQVLIAINKKVGFRLLTKFGERGAINLVKLVPLAGGVIGGGVDGTACYVMGKRAKRLFCA